MKWYVLFVKTGSENKILGLLKSYLNLQEVYPFIPKRKMVFRRNGFEIKHECNCFPGYIFFKSEIDKEMFMIEVLPIIRRIDDAFKFINYGEKYDIVMHEKERIILEYLLGDTLCIDYSVGIIENNKVKINSGPLMGIEGLIKKINRHRREAVIEINMMGNVQKLIISLQIVEKI